MNEPMFTTRLYKTDRGWSFENIITDVLPKDVNTCYAMGGRIGDKLWSTDTSYMELQNKTSRLMASFHT